MSFLNGSDRAFHSSTVLLSVECRVLRRELRPLVWVILEEVALDAVVEDDARLVARTSARRVAERLRVDPGTAATALRALRQRGLVSLEREKVPGGRFDMSVYELRSISGLSVVRLDGSVVTHGDGSARRSRPSTASAAQPAPSLQCPGQESFDRESEPA
jgi:hypothetical protein